MSSSARPAAIVFDLYGTLLDLRSLEGVVAPLSSQAAGFVALWRSKQLEYTFLRTLMGRYVDFWQVTGDALDNTLERYPLVLHSGQRIGLMNAWLTLEPYPEVEAALDLLKGQRLAVLSNGSPPMLEAGLSYAGLAGRFEAVLSVDAVRAYKPAPAVYALACKELALEPSQMLFVSANGFDVAGAASAGLQVAWLDRNGLPLDRLGPAPALRASNLLGLVEMVTRRE